MQLVADVIHLVETAEGHRHGLQSVDGRFDFRRPVPSEAGIDCRFASADHVGLAPLYAIRKNCQSNGAARCLALLSPMANKLL
jgi:hypothetical protein